MRGVPDRFVVMDFETTGLDGETHQVISVCAVEVFKSDVSMDGGRLAVKPSGKQLTCLIKPLPGARVTAKITELTGLTRERLLKEGRPAGDVWPELVRMLDNAWVVAYNAPFEEKFLRGMCAKTGIPMPYVNFECALQLSRDRWPGLDGYRLSQMAERLGLDTSNAHEAEADVGRTLMVYLAAKLKP
jgi:DNA polymerase III epsilon subunit-like protein